jgi:hypothetical protein
MKRAVFSLAGVVVLVMLARVEGFACTCGLPPMNSPLKRQVRAAPGESRAVFSGKVLEVRGDPQTLFVLVRLRVERVWKGAPRAEARIFTGRGGGDCGYQFEVGESYLVYAYRWREGELGTNICQRTAKLSEAAKDLQILGKGRSAPRRPAGKGAGRL